MGDEQPRTNDLYDMEAVLDRVRNAARLYLSDPWTVETVRWEDGDFRVEAFHTIDETYPFEEEYSTPGGLDGDDALPFYRERVVFSTTTDPGYVFLEVVRKRTGRTRAESVYRTPVEFVGIRDPRTADAALTLDGEEHVLRDLDLQNVSLVPSEDVEGFGGGVARVPDDPDYARFPSGEISIDVDLSEEELQEFRDRFEEGA